MWGWVTPYWRRLVVAGVVFGLVALLPAVAGVRTTSVTHAYKVPGTTAKGVVTYMLRNPFPGDHGGAFANIRPKYKLSVSSRSSGGLCRAKSVDVDIRFVITLPEARDIKRMSAKTRSAWRSFAAFARRHEETHRQSYIGCANSFVTAARREKAESCHALDARIRRMFEQAKRGCEARQSAFDRQQRHIVPGLALFDMAGY
jgi:predicted secreted Zn-dependent protease